MSFREWWAVIILVLLDFLRQGRGLGQSDEGKIMKKKKKKKISRIILMLMGARRKNRLSK